jgi:hypothetical protein
MALNERIRGLQVNSREDLVVFGSVLHAKPSQAPSLLVGHDQTQPNATSVLCLS